MLLLYVLSQKPDFSESVKPLFGNLKNTEDLLKFLNDLNKFSEFFAAFKQPNIKNATNDSADAETKSKTKYEKSANENAAKPSKEDESTEKPSPSPTAGIASDYIEKCLDAYFKKR